MQSVASHEVEKFINQISLLVTPRMLKYLIQTGCSTTGKPTRSFATERVSLDSV
jgi:hypothetical protein